MDEIRLFADYHTHTQYRNPRIKVEAHMRAAQRVGLTEVGITDHGPNTIGTRMLAATTKVSLGKNGGIRLLEQVRDAVFEIRQRDAAHAVTGMSDASAPFYCDTWMCSKSSAKSSAKGKAEEPKEAAPKVTPLAGVEANVIGEDGELDVPPAFLESLDIVLAGLHQWVVPRTIGSSLYFGPFGAALGRTRLYKHKARTIYTKAMVEAVLRNRIDVVTHPGLGFDIDTLELARACAKRGTALEINSSHSSTSIDYVRIAAKAGALFVISSDAHSPQNVGDLERGLILAKRAKLSSDQIINAQDAKGGEKGLLAKTRKRKAKTETKAKV